MPDEGGLRVFHLDRYIIKRDPMGNIIYIATKETIAYSALPEEMQETLELTKMSPINVTSIPPSIDTMINSTSSKT